MKTVFMAMATLLLLGACAQPSPSEGKQAANPERYARDRDLCRAQVDELMKTRRTIDDSRTEVLSGERDRFGQNGLPDQMAAYGDNRRSDNVMSSCMEARGWAQPAKSWWQKIGS